MKLATQEDVDLILKETHEWASNHTMFSSARGAARLAAAEFALNREGKTMYMHNVKYSGE